MSKELRKHKETEETGSLEASLEGYLTWAKTHHFSSTTLCGKRSNLGFFQGWCDARGLTSVTGIELKHLEAYGRWLKQLRKVDGDLLKAITVYDRLNAVQVFFKWLVRQGVLLMNPCSELELPKVPKPLPRYLSVPQMERILSEVDVGTLRGIRDRTILELFYSTGIRRGELKRLKINDIHAAEQTLHVNQGKGRKDRVVPIGERALEWVALYLEKVREDWVSTPDEGILFLTSKGNPLHISDFSPLVRGYLERARIEVRGACHLFRHGMATAMLENGANIRYIQEILGHQRLQTTQIYTHVAIKTLQKVHSQTHPLEKEAKAEA
jgi:integrase/recombinase XerD